MDLKHELQRIISGVGQNSGGDLVKAAAHHLGKSQEASRNAEKIEFTKDQEATQLVSWIKKSNLWFTGVDERIKLSNISLNGSNQLALSYMR